MQRSSAPVARRKPLGSNAIAFDFDFGYDSSGIQAYRQSQSTADLLKGFYLSDRKIGGKDQAEVQLNGVLAVTMQTPRIPDIPLPVPRGQDPSGVWRRRWVVR